MLNGINRHTHSYEKGTTVNPTELNAISASMSKTDSFAMLRWLSCPLGTSARPGRRTVIRQSASLTLARGLAGIVAILVGMSLFASSAFALEATGTPGPPRFTGYIYNKEVYSTSAKIAVEFHSEFLATKWTAEYATTPNGPWTVVSSGEVTEQAALGSQGHDAYIGVADSVEPDTGGYNLRDLKPNTSYYVRFTAENKDGHASESVSFKTLPVEKPRIALNYGSGWLPGEFTTFHMSGSSTDTAQAFRAKVETDGALTEYSFEYAPAETGGARPSGASVSWKIFSSNARGTITEADEYARVEAQLTNLTPETTYYVRLKANNEKGEITQTEYLQAGSTPLTGFFTTSTAKPGLGLGIRNITANSVYLAATVQPRESQTVWRLEYAQSQELLEEDKGIVVPSGQGTIPQAQASPYSKYERFGASLTGLSPSKVYYVRLFGENDCAVGCGTVTTSIERFETSGAPSVSTSAVHALYRESLRLLGAVNPNSLPTSAEQVITIEGAPTGGTFTLTLDGNTTAPIPFDADDETVSTALGDGLLVTGPAGGPYTVYFGFGNDSDFNGVSVPLIEADPLGLSPGATVSVVTSQAGGAAYDTHYHFEYVSQKQFEMSGGEGGFANAISTPEVDLGSGNSSEVVGETITSFHPGETYRYRIVASNNAPGTSSVLGEEHRLTVPVAQTVSGVSACPNAAFRTGLSADLPDCRAYEQVTPVEKEGAQEPFHYRGGELSAVLAGEDGDHAVLEAPEVSYGTAASAGQSPYFFSREEGKAWRMIAGAPQPEIGLNSVIPELYNADLTQFAFESEYKTSISNESPDVDYKVGSAGGPYMTAVSVPRKDDANTAWVAANSDFSKLILQSEDRNLVGEGATGTRSGSDLYEYAPGRRLAQLNVNTAGLTIGSCGATIVHGAEKGGNTHVDSGPRSVSVDGSRVFFEAVPGKNCSEPKHLYMRMDGVETVDLGVGGFLAANEEGSEVLLEKPNGGVYEIFLYDTMSGTETKLFTTNSQFSQDDLYVAGAGKLTALYFASREKLASEASQLASNNELRNIYRYDLNTKEPPQFVILAAGAPNSEFLAAVSPDGRYAYFESAGVAGLPGGGKELQADGEIGPDSQVYRFDSSEDVVECVSCSAFDPEPKHGSHLDGVQGLPFVNGGSPSYSAVSSNGEYVFFTTIAALVPGDVDLELPAEGLSEPGTSGEFLNSGGRISPSTDVYEWREDGVDGCNQDEGCLALITDGRGGYLNLLLGTTDDGNDVFIYTRSKLSPFDVGTEGDIYDVRVDGGFQGPPPRSTECEGDACSTPLSPPSDATPSSLTFSGPGNLPSEATVKTKAKAKKPKKKSKSKGKAKDKGKRKNKKNAKKTARKIVEKRAGKMGNVGKSDVRGGK